VLLALLVAEVGVQPLPPWVPLLLLLLVLLLLAATGVVVGAARPSPPLLLLQESVAVVAAGRTLPSVGVRAAACLLMAAAAWRLRHQARAHQPHEAGRVPAPLLQVGRQTRACGQRVCEGEPLPPLVLVASALLLLLLLALLQARPARCMCALVGVGTAPPHSPRRRRRLPVRPWRATAVCAACGASVGRCCRLAPVEARLQVRLQACPSRVHQR
jgi:hypothetical protein